MQLLLKIIETHNLSVNTAKVAEAWREFVFCIPKTQTQLTLAAGDANSKPTPRAITERLVKLRQMAAPNATSKVSISKGGIAGSTAQVTPRKPRTPGKSASGGSGKRKRVEEVAIKAEPDAEDGVESEKSQVKKEPGSDEITLADVEALEEESPSKRVRKPTAHLNMVLFEDDSEDSTQKNNHKRNISNNSSGSEYVPEDVIDQENATKVKTEMDVDDDETANLWA